MAYSALLSLPQFVNNDGECHLRDALSQSTTSRTPANNAKKIKPYNLMFDSALCHRNTHQAEQLGTLEELDAFNIDISTGSVPLIKAQLKAPEKEVREDLDDSDSSDDSSNMPEERAPADQILVCVDRAESSDACSSMEEFDAEIDQSESNDELCKDFSCEHSRVLDNEPKNVPQVERQVKGGVYVTDVLCPKANESFHDLNENGNQLIWSDEEDSDILEHYSISTSVISPDIRRDKRDSLCDPPQLLPSCNMCFKAVGPTEPSASTIGTKISTRKVSRKVIAMCTGLCSCNLRRTHSQPRRTESDKKPSFRAVSFYCKDVKCID